MKRIKLVKGNDVTFRIEVTQKEGSSSVPVNFSGVTDLEVYLHNSGKRKMDVTTAGNVVTMPVQGSEQLTGDIGIEAVWGENSHRFFYPNVGCFVNTTDEADYLSSDDISVETVELSADILAAPAGGSTSGKSPYIGDNGNWFEFNDQAAVWADTGIKAAGLKGDKGDPGGQGLQGIPGAQGDKGDRGEKGEAGISGPAGAAAPLPQIQYTTDCISWHTVKTDEDLYWRISVDGGVTWCDAILLKDTVPVSAETASTKTITPGTFYLWREVASLDITLSPPANSNNLNEYMFQFTSGAAATTLTLPASVVFPSTVSIKSGKTYQISIVNNLGLIGEF